MLSGDKRASLSSGLLAARDQAPMSDGDAEQAAPAASLFAVPHGAARQRMLAAVRPALDESPAADAAPEESGVAPATGEPVAADPVLYSKGDASASGFRPSYWSYERGDEAPGRDDAQQPTKQVVSETSLAVAATAPAMGASGYRVAMALVAGFSALALVGAATLFVLSRAEPQAAVNAGPSVVMAPALPMMPPAPPPPRPTHVAALPPAAHPATAAPMPAQELAELMARGAQMLATGDIAAARLFYERAAAGGSAAAAREAGKTYDPLALAEAHARGIRGDPVAAARWYRRASEGGDKQADLLMKRLMAKYAG